MHTAQRVLARYLTAKKILHTIKLNHGVMDKRMAENVYEAAIVATSTPDTFKVLEKQHAEGLVDDSYLERWRRNATPVGTQFVVSWHQTLDNARKALRGPNTPAVHRRRDGWDVEIRTDIEIKS